MLFTDMEERMDKHSFKHNYKAYSPFWGLKCLLAFLMQFNVLPPKVLLQTWNFSGNNISFGRMPKIGIWVLCVFVPTQNSEYLRTQPYQTKLRGSLGKGVVHISLGIFLIDLIHFPLGKQLLERCNFK